MHFLFVFRLPVNISECALFTGCLNLLSSLLEVSWIFYNYWCRNLIFLYFQNSNVSVIPIFSHTLKLIFDKFIAIHSLYESISLTHSSILSTKIVYSKVFLLGAHRSWRWNARGALIYLLADMECWQPSQKWVWP